MAATTVYTRSDRFEDGKCHQHLGSENKYKRGRQKTVTWPMDEKLCEVCHFLVDDAPSFLGKQRSLPFAHNIPCYKESINSIRHHPIEAKRARLTSVTNLAPGFGLPMARSTSVPKVESDALMRTAASWHRPCKFILDEAWLWAGGEESSEVALQQQRELRLFEAFYPRFTSIPDSPAEPVESCKQVDCSLLEIPLIPLEEEETEDIEPEKMIENDVRQDSVPELMEITDPLKHTTEVPKHGDDDMSCCHPVAGSTEMNQLNLMNEADSNIAAVAAAACMVVKSLGESDLVDEKLLLQLLKNPALLQSLTRSNMFSKNEGKVKNSDTARQISKEATTSVSRTLLLDHGAYSNASPVSVLTRWEEGATFSSPSGTTPPIANGSANIQQPAIAIMNPTITSPVIGSFPLQASHKTPYIGGNHRENAKSAVQEICTNGPRKSRNLQESTLVHTYKPKDEAKPSCQNVLCNNLHSCSCSMQSTPPTVTPAIGPLSGLSTLLLNSELPCRAPLLGDLLLKRVVQEVESKTMQSKSVSPNVAVGGRAKRICMYFNSPRGCRNGHNCAFVHQLLDSELNTMAL